MSRLWQLPGRIADAPQDLGLNNQPLADTSRTSCLRVYMPYGCNTSTKRLTTERGQQMTLPHAFHLDNHRSIVDLDTNTTPKQSVMSLLLMQSVVCQNHCPLICTRKGGGPMTRFRRATRIGFSVISRQSSTTATTSICDEP